MLRRHSPPIDPPPLWQMKRFRKVSLIDSIKKYFVEIAFSLLFIILSLNTLYCMYLDT